MIHLLFCMYDGWEKKWHTKMGFYQRVYHNDTFWGCVILIKNNNSLSYNKLKKLARRLQYYWCKQKSIKESKTGYAISAEIPGYKENEINLYVENHVLTLEGKKEEKEDERSNDGKKYLIRERVVRNFKRSFTLPEDADEEKVSATFKNGVLEVDLPKVEKAQPKRIEVKAN